MEIGKFYIKKSRKSRKSRKSKSRKSTVCKYVEYNKTRKNKKMIGGGMSEEDIIDELKTKGKYDEWVSLGSKFGLTSDTLQSKYFSVRPFKYYDVDGNIVNVSMVAKKYRPDVDNIAVFEQFVDPTLIDPWSFRPTTRREPIMVERPSVSHYGYPRKAPFTMRSDYYPGKVVDSPDGY